ncbi:MAG: T9SS type A sorting domain-containing protein, partial [Salibacteraceae bacterium]
VIYNNGSADQTGFSIGYTFDGFAITPEVVSATVPAFGTLEYTFSTLASFTNPGSTDIEVYTMLAGDVDLSNDTIMDQLTKTLLVSTFPYSESFATGEQGWIIDNTNNGTWAFGNPNKPSVTGAASDTNAFVTGGLTGQYSANEEAYVYSPCFDFTTLDDPYVQMSVWYESEFSWDGGQLQYSVDGGDNWNILGEVGEGENWYRDNTLNGLDNTSGWCGRNGTGTTGGSNGWKTATISAMVLAGAPDVKFRVAFGSDGSVQDEGFGFDDFAIFNGATLGNDTVLCTSDTLTLNPGIYSGYLWSDSTIVPVKYLDAAVLPEGTDTINVIVSATGGFKMYDTVVVTVEKPTVSIGNDTVVCFGETVTLDAGTGFATYQWSDGSTMQTLITDGSTSGSIDYSVLALTANDCPAVDTVNVSVNTEVLVDLGQDTIFSDSLTQGTSYTLDAGPGFASYLWQDGATTQTYLVDKNTIDTAFSVVVTNASGCEGSDSVMVDFRLGVNALEISTITMYPNPTTDNITIEVSNFTALGDVNVNILDITGKVVMTEKLNGNGSKFKETYDVTHLATGTYFVQFEANGEVQTRQFIIK